MNDTKRKYTSWSDIKKSKSIEFIEDPLTSMELFKIDFEETYKEILDTLKADNYYIDTCIEYYFDIHPLRKNCLIFKDDDKKNEFYELGIELDCVPSLKSVNDGTYTN